MTDEDMDTEGFLTEVVPRDENTTYEEMREFFRDTVNFKRPTADVSLNKCIEALDEMFDHFGVDTDDKEWRHTVARVVEATSSLIGSLQRAGWPGDRAAEMATDTLAYLVFTTEDERALTPAAQKRKDELDDLNRRLLSGDVDEEELMALIGQVGREALQEVYGEPNGDDDEPNRGAYL